MASFPAPTACKSTVSARAAPRRRRRRRTRAPSMFEALVVTLREGVEVALVVGIIAAFLRREAAGRHMSAVWAGIAAAIGASVLGGYLLHRLAVDENVLEELLYLAAAAAGR